MKSYSHLHFHSKYSLLDAINDSKECAIMAKKDDQPALALTDHGNLYGALEHYKACKDVGIKPILGCEIYLVEKSRLEKQTNRNGINSRNHLTLLAVNNVGWKNLMHLVSDAHINGKNGQKPCADLESLEQYNEGIIALSGCLSSQTSRAILNNDLRKAKEYCEKYLSIFGRDRFFLEFMKTNFDRQNLVNDGLYSLMRNMNIRPIASNDVHWPCKEDHDIHDTLICRQDSPSGTPKSQPKRMRYETTELYFKSSSLMRTLFNDLPEACDNTLLIAEMADIEIELGKLKMPKFPDPENISEEERFQLEIQKGFQKRYPNPTKEIRDRLEHEISVITRLNFVGYFLIVWDIVNYCKEKGIAVGAGRGSAAGSIVAYCLGITDVDPIKWNLLFERFLNPERVSMPDVDVDVSQTRRNEVINYIRNTYGKDRVAKIGTSLRILAKGAVRTFGKILEIPPQEHQAICKKIPESPGVKIPEVLQNDSELENILDKYPRAKKHILRLEGIPSHVGVHAAGILIADRPIQDIVPLTKSKDEICTQWTMEEVEDCGLLKMDFLGLKNLSIIDECYRLIQERENISKEELHRLSSSCDDPNVFKYIFQKADTLCVFQFESSTMKPYLLRMKPDSMDNIIALNALCRPGPINSGMTDSYINRKLGKEKVSYIDKRLKEITHYTYGLPIYQEQLMGMTQNLAGWSMGKADILRRAIGKKKIDVLESLREKFIKDAIDNDTIPEVAEKCFEDINRFADYGFNLCLSGYTKVYRSSGNQHGDKEEGVSIQHLYKVKNDLNYAKENNCMSLRKKMQLKDYGYGNILALDTDGKIRPKKVKNITKIGQRETYLILISGWDKKNETPNIRATANHRFLTARGWLEVSQIKPGDKIAMNAGYIKSEKKARSNFAGAGRTHKNPNYQPTTGQEGFQPGEENHGYLDGNWLELKEVKESLSDQKSCSYCGIYFSETIKPEHHHIDGNPLNNSFENITKLCNSCHKKADYKLGTRKKRYSKGLEVKFVEVSSVLPSQYEDVYDLEMEEEPHAFVANGFISHNSHAVSYTLASYQMAWLKYYYPSEFYAANLSYEKPSEGVFGEILEEAKKKKIKVLLPDVNLSDEKCSVENKNIRLGLSRIKGIGEGKAKDIKINRPEEGYNSIAEFHMKCPEIDKGGIEALIKSGSFDFLKKNRGTLVSVIDSEVSRGKAWSSSAEKGTWTLFGDGLEDRLDPLQNWPSGKEWPKDEIQKGEDETLEFYFSGHPLLENLTKYVLCTTVTTEMVSNLPTETKVSIAGIVRDLKIIKIKNGKNAGKTMAKLTLEDMKGRIPLIVFSDQFSSYHNVLKDKETLVFTGKTQLDNEKIELRVETIETIKECIENSISSVQIIVDVDKLKDVNDLKSLLHQNDNQKRVGVDLYMKSNQSTVQASVPYKISLSLDFAEKAEKILGKGCLRRIR